MIGEVAFAVPGAVNKRQRSTSQVWNTSPGEGRDQKGYESQAPTVQQDVWEPEIVLARLRLADAE